MIRLKDAALFVLGMVCVFAFYYGWVVEAETQTTLTTFVAETIPDDRIMITSAGQNIEAYIVQDVVNESRLNNWFIPEARAADLEGISAVIISVGYSELGIDLHKSDLVSEKERIEAVLTEALERKTPVICIYLGGAERRSVETDKLLELAVPGSDYLIALAAGDEDRFLTDLSEAHQVPAVFIQDLQDLEKPLASLFR